MEQAPKQITLAKLSVLVMPNGEVLCSGKTLGWVPTDKGLARNLSDFRDGITSKPIKKEDV